MPDQESGHRLLPNPPVQIAPQDIQMRQLPTENSVRGVDSSPDFPVNRKLLHRSLTVDLQINDTDSNHQFERKPSGRSLPVEPKPSDVSAAVTLPSRQSSQSLSSKRSNFRRCHEVNVMGHESSRPALHSRPMFSGSFDSSVKKRVNFLPTRTGSTASEEAAHDLKGSDESFGLTASVGSIQITSTNTEKKTNGKPKNGRNGRKPQQLGISNSAQSIINFCTENAKGDIATRVVNRMASKRDDFGYFISGLSSEQWAEYVNSLRNYFGLVIQSLQSLEKIREISMQYGDEQVKFRAWGLKADFFSILAGALTIECVFLDGAAHSTPDVIEAFSELIEPMFSSIRDGYYQKIRQLRKNSHCLSSRMFSQSSEMSNDEATSSHR